METKTDNNREYGVPVLKEQRERIRFAAKAYAAKKKLVPPLSMEELRTHAELLMSAHSINPQYTDYVLVLLNNEVWSETLASIPYERRLLLLPQCLRNANECPAEMDEFGLLCEECGRCPIGELQTLAEDLGYVVLVAEGSTVVTKLLEGGKVDAVIGVSCLNALEKSFPHMAAEAIPGLAIPLNFDGCINTEVDLDWVREAIRLKSPEGWKNRLDTDLLRDEVNQWFEPSAISEILDSAGTTTGSIAIDWMTVGGKRWRPFLLACTYSAVKDGITSLPDEVRRLAVAVECFHKASLIHDDIEDNDDFRYGAKTLHLQYGIPVALNVGDLLMGEGYRLIASVEHRTVELLRIAAENHRMLCLGQGEELCGLQRQEPFSSEEVLALFRRKTAPAFNVSLMLGAVAAECTGKLGDILSTFSESLGMAYQIRDDLMEYTQEDDEVFDHRRLRPSLLLALAYEHAKGATRGKILSIWRSSHLDAADMKRIRHIFEELMVIEKTQQLLEHYKNEAIRALNPLQNALLKSLLRRITTKMLNGV